jgi:hypothetical protein
MIEYPAGQVEKNGQTVDIHVTEFGNWGAKVASNVLSAETKAKLIDKIATATKQAVVKVAVAFTELGVSGGGYGYPAKPYARSGTATGFHAANGNILVTWSDGSRTQLTEHLLRVAPLAQEERVEYVQLAKAEQEARRALHAWEAAHRFDLKEAVKKAIDEA